MAQRYSRACIGLDLDNTLITYDQLFKELAVEHQLVPAGFVGSKRDVRDQVRSLPGGDVQWQRLQAQAYGPAIARASAAEGALEFIHEARRHGAALMIISHKTSYSSLGRGRVNLHDAACGWLRANGIIGNDAILEASVYFEESREAKIARIGTLGCTHFVDDLHEVLNSPGFPTGVERMLLNAWHPDDTYPYRYYASFRDIARVFAD